MWSNTLFAIYCLIVIQCVSVSVARAQRSSTSRPEDVVQVFERKLRDGLVIAAWKYPEGREMVNGSVARASQTELVLIDFRRNQMTSLLVPPSFILEPVQAVDYLDACATEDGRWVAVIQERGKTKLLCGPVAIAQRTDERHFIIGDPIAPSAVPVSKRATIEQIGDAACFRVTLVTEPSGLEAQFLCLFDNKGEPGWWRPAVRKD
jgi:hypothetical protein